MPRVSRSEIRKHYFTDEYVIIAPKRALRPHTLRQGTSTHLGETATSPAIEKDRAILRINDEHGDWRVKVIANKFPALSLDNAEAYGKQEVVIETPLHNTEFSQLPLSQVERIFEAYRQRTHTLRQLPGIKHVSVFKNDGPAAGASIAHAHSQIVALPFVPPLVAQESHALISYLQEYGSCAYCDAIAWELRETERIVSADEHIVAFAPFASKYQFECWFLPRRDVATFAELTDAERHSLAIALHRVTGKLDKAGISFNFFLQDSIVGASHHFVLKLQPRQGSWAGLELSTGVIINQVAPERAAAWYRK